MAQHLIDYLTETVGQSMGLFDLQRVDAEICQTIPQINSKTLVWNDVNLPMRHELVFPQTVQYPIAPLEMMIKTRQKRIRRPGLRNKLWRVAGELFNRPEWTARGCGTITKMHRSSSMPPMVSLSERRIEVKRLEMGMDLSPRGYGYPFPSKYLGVWLAYDALNDTLYIDIKIR